MNKAILVKNIIAILTGKAALYHDAARAAHAEATDEESKAEDKYDTRGLEASYLASGQARQMAETAVSLQEFSTMTVRKFGPHEPVDIGALVKLEVRGEHSFYFIGPSAGGIELTHGKSSVLVITPQSPLGRQLMGGKPGDHLKINVGGQRSECRVVSVL